MKVEELEIFLADANPVEWQHFRNDISATVEKLIAVLQSVLHYERCEIPTRIIQAIDALDPKLKPWGPEVPDPELGEILDTLHDSVHEKGRRGKPVKVTRAKRKESDD